MTGICGVKMKRTTITGIETNPGSFERTASQSLKLSAINGIQLKYVFTLFFCANWNYIYFDKLKRELINTSNTEKHEKFHKTFIKFRSRKAKKTLLENKTKSIFSALWINFALYKSRPSYMWTEIILKLANFKTSLIFSKS